MAKYKIIPCSGIGKVFGLLAREAAYAVAGPDAEVVCLGHVVKGDEAGAALVAGCPCITIDGCNGMCAAKSVRARGGEVKANYCSLITVRQHRGMAPGTAADLTEDGWQLADALAADIRAKIAELEGGGE